MFPFVFGQTHHRIVVSHVLQETIKNFRCLTVASVHQLLASATVSGSIYQCQRRVA